MSVKSKIRLWTTGIGEYYSGSLYRQNRFPLFWLFSRVLRRVELAEEHVEELSKLSKRGVVVYALKNKSRLNCLILRELSFRKGIQRPVYCHGISMIIWQPFFPAVRVFLSHLFHFIFKKTILNPDKTEYLKRITLDKSSSIIYLRGSEFMGSKYVRDPIIQLINAQRELDVPVYLVPELVAYGRRREKKDKTLLNILFGQRGNPGALRRLITFLRNSKRASVISARPINLAEFIKKNEDLSEEDISCSLRRELIDRIDGEKRAIVGPVLKSREEIIGTVLRDGDLVEFMEDMAADGKKDYNMVVRKAEKYLREIAADYNETYIEIWYRVLTWLWNNIYDGVVVDREGLARIRDVSKKMPFVIVPCHRSHTDYLLLSYVFYKYNIQLPFVAAGTNMLFGPLGYIFRKSGTFFVRRSFRGNVFYGEVFAKYVKVLLQEGLPIEFFIEGGRSRTGKMVMPRYGLLSMVIQAYEEGACDDLAIIPVFIGYDRILEEKSYLEELGGAPKEREKTLAVIKSRKLLKKRYGSVYINIAEPILLKSYLASREKSLDDMTVSERQSLYRKIGYEIVGEISEVSVVTPFSLIALGLLSHYRRGISHGDLMSIANELYDYLVFKNVKFSSTFDNTDKAVEDVLNLLESSGIISKTGTEEGDEDEFEEIVYSLADDKRLNLEYYKNNILHFFLPLSFVATSILSSSEDTVPLYQIMEDYRFLKRLFRHEFIFDYKKDDVDEVNSVLSYIYDRGMIVGEERASEAWIEVKGKGRTNLRPFAGLIHNYIESYWVAIRGCSYLKKGEKSEKDFIRKIQKLGAKMRKKGEVLRAEALSRSNYQNAVKFLTDAEILDKGERKNARIYFLTEDKTRIELLRHRLFKFL
ncbi:MAG: 1-acyl-sn-glycerol-3-phosphate acyltransferase [Proteobacteria bacterium]|nr:1-acyl-sn-glycerol-3-phosphate acyltransferase [Pseudomonadota bacterium]